MKSFEVELTFVMMALVMVVFMVASYILGYRRIQYEACLNNNIKIPMENQLHILNNHVFSPSTKKNHKISKVTSYGSLFDLSIQDAMFVKSHYLS